MDYDVESVRLNRRQRTTAYGRYGDAALFGVSLALIVFSLSAKLSRAQQNAGLGAESRRNEVQHISRCEISESFPGKSATLDAEARNVCEQLWEKILTNCGGSYYYQGSNLGQGVLEPTALKNQQMMKEARGQSNRIQTLTARSQASEEPIDPLTEYQAVTFELHPRTIMFWGDELAAASSGKNDPTASGLIALPPDGVPDRIAALLPSRVEWLGVAIMRSKKWRQSIAAPGEANNRNQITWQDWSGPISLGNFKFSGPEDIVPGLIGMELKEAFSSFIPFGNSSVLMVQMWKLDGKWFFSRSLVVPSREDRFELGEITGPGHPRCQEGELVTGGFHSIGRSEMDAPALASRNPGSTGDSNLESRTYRGSVDGFAPSLPKFFQQAIASGVTAGDYSPEMQYITVAARNCGLITAEMIAAGSAHGLIDTPRFQEQYIPCLWGSDLNVSANARRKDGSFEHLEGSVMMRIKPRGKWGDGTGFNMTVYWVKRKASSSDLKVVDAVIGTE